MAGYRSFSLYKRKRKSGKPVYYCQFRLLDGTRTPGRSTGETSKAAAERWALNQLEYGKPVKRKNVTLAEFATEEFFSWGSDWAIDILSAGKRLSERQCQEKNAILKNHIIPTLGKTRLTDINKAVIKQFRNDLYRDGYSSSTINKVLSSIHAILEAAEDHGLINGVPTVSRVAETWEERGSLTVSEVKELFSIPWDDFISYTANLTAANTGMRKSELLGLQRRSLFLEEMRINVNQVWERDTEKLIPKTKSGKPRFIPISTRVGEALQKLLSMNPYDSENAFIFFSPETPDKPMNGKHFNEELYKQLERIGIDGTQRKERKLVFHSWRHWMNTVLVNERIPIPIVQKITGHLTESMTKRYYHDDEMQMIRKLQEAMF